MTYIYLQADESSLRLQSPALLLSCQVAGHPNQPPLLGWDRSARARDYADDPPAAAGSPVAAAACRLAHSVRHYWFPARLSASATRTRTVPAGLLEMYPAKPCAPAGMAAAPVVGFPVAGALRQQWSSGLFDCLDDCHICKPS